MNGTKLKKWYGCFYGLEVDDFGNPVAGAEMFTFGEMSELSLTFSGEPIIYKGRSCDTNNVTLATRPGRDDKVEGKLRLDDWAPEVIAAAFRATEKQQTITASTLTGKSVTLVGFDKFVDIGTKRLTNVVVKDNGGTVLEPGVDYQINEYLGYIAPLRGGALTTGTETITIDADGQADSTTELTIAAGTMKKFRITGSVINEWNGKMAELDLYKVSLSPDGDIVLHDRTDDEVSVLSFTANPEGVPGKTGVGTFAGEALM